jgi:hypothetical protein
MSIVNPRQSRFAASGAMKVSAAACGNSVTLSPKESIVSVLGAAREADEVESEPGTRPGLATSRMDNSGCVPIDDSVSTIIRLQSKEAILFVRTFGTIGGRICRASKASQSRPEKKGCRLVSSKP